MAVDPQHCETEFCPCGSEIALFGDLDPEVDSMSNGLTRPMAVNPYHRYLNEAERAN